MNEEQKVALRLMARGDNIFLTGMGGSGKTFLINEFIKFYKDAKNIAVTSTTGTSAILLKGGKTIHSWAGIGLGNGSIHAMITKIRKKPYLRNRWKNVEVLIIDEISMLTCELFEKLNKIAKVIRKSEIIFGGIQLILTGDFLQLPCIESEYFCFESQIWDKSVDEIIYLKENMRQNDKEWIECLNHIRFGDITPEVLTILESCKTNDLTNEYGIIPTTLYPLNIDVEELNNFKLNEMLEQNCEIYEYNQEFNAYNNKKGNQYVYEKFKKSCPCMETLNLALKCQVMLLCNLDIEMGLVNGSRGIIVGFTSTDLPIVKFLNGITRIIDYHVWECEENDTKFASIEQIPLKLGYAFSIHKAQGCSIDYVVTDLTDIFTYGQAYVALSRVRNLKGLKIVGLNISKIKAHPKAVEFYRKLN